MGDKDYKVYNVVKGDCSWIAAKKILMQKGVKNITTQMIVEEMNRLVKINNKANLETFNNDYFATLPSSFYTDIEKQQKAQQQQIKQYNSSFGNDSTINIEDNQYTALNNSIYVERLPENIKIKTDTPEEIEIENINKIKDDKQKIIQFNKNHAKKNYLIIDKKKCIAEVYSPRGELLKSVPVGTGKKIGDKMNKGLKNGQWDAAGAYTPAGQFTLKSCPRTAHNIHGYKSDRSDNLNLYSLDGIQHDTDYKENVSIAIHQVPKYRRAERNHLLQDDKTTHNISNNRMSFGCINVLDTDFEEMNKFIGAGSTLYILPEEKDNSLRLDTNPKGQQVFKIEYSNSEDQNIADKAEMQYYKIDFKTSLELALKKIS